MAIFGAGFIAVFVGGMALTRLAPTDATPQPAAASGGNNFMCTVRYITDGDTLRCADGTRVRISGINAREKDGTCNRGAPCPTASSDGATAELSRLASGQC